MYIINIAAICLIISLIILEQYIVKNGISDFDHVVRLHLLILACSLLWFISLPIIISLVIGKLIYKVIYR